MMLFNYDDFTLHSGRKSNFKIDCDALSDDDITNLAALIQHTMSFKEAVGVPRGGLRLAQALNQYKNLQHDTLLLVDDVLTTGKSMIECKDKYSNEKVRGVVIFARNECPEWITPIFTGNVF